MMQASYRKIPGGLDNAVRHAEIKGLNEMFIVDADCHQDEPFTLFSKYLPEKYRKEFTNERLLTIARKYEEDYSKYAIEGDAPRDDVKIALSALQRMNRAPGDRTMGGRVKRPEVRSRLSYQTHNAEMRPEELVDLFTKRMHDIGIKRSIVFPTQMLEIGTYSEHGVEIAVANAYIDYMLDKFLGKYPEILTCVYAPPNRPEEAAELVERTGSEEGVVGVFVTPNGPCPLSGDESWDPIYRVAQKKGLPVIFHGAAGKLPPFDKFKSFLGRHALGFPWYLVLQITSLVIEGVPERFPNLKFGFIEGGVSWIPWVMYRLDDEYRKRRSEAPLLKKMPSEYMKEFYYSSQPLERPTNIRDLEWIFKAFDAENHLMYASDYPHWDFDTPSAIYDLPFLSREAKEKILGQNAKKLFRLGN
jgi:predicted TIM-barrel fold metal-dependent hydrolase